MTRVADIFEKRGMRVSFAVVPSSLTEAQGACLRELVARGLRSITMKEQYEERFGKIDATGR